MGSLAWDSASPSQGRRRSHCSSTTAEGGWVIRDFHFISPDQKEEGSWNTRSCSHVWEISWCHFWAFRTNGGYGFNSAGSRPLHSWGSNHISPISEHLSSNYPCASLNRWGGWSDTGQSGQVTGILIPDDTFCFLIYYYYNFDFRTIFPLCLHILLVLFMGN